LQYHSLVLYNLLAVILLTLQDQTNIKIGEYCNTNIRHNDEQPIYNKANSENTTKKKKKKDGRFKGIGVIA